MRFLFNALAALLIVLASATTTDAAERLECNWQWGNCEVKAVDWDNNGMADYFYRCNGSYTWQWLDELPLTSCDP